jgi:GNAT superfamily N-acetyltransferase
LKWLYFENPVGKAIAYSAYYNDEMVSHFATVPVNYIIDGINKKGLLALNLVTHPEHRGKGLFVEIAKQTIEDAKNEGFDFMIGVANQNSSHGLIKTLGFGLISTLSVVVGIGTVKPLYDHKYRLAPIWSQDTLAWRLSNPSSKLFLSSDNSYVVPTGKLNFYAQLTSRTVKQQNSSKCKKRMAPFKVWIGLSSSMKKRGLFFKLPKALKPVPLNLIYKNLSGENMVFNPTDVLFELIDFDAY